MLLECQRDWARKETYDATVGIAKEPSGAFGMGIDYPSTLVHKRPSFDRAAPGAAPREPTGRSRRSPSRINPQRCCAGPWPSKHHTNATPMFILFNRRQLLAGAAALTVTPGVPPQGATVDPVLLNGHIITIDPTHAEVQHSPPKMSCLSRWGPMLK